MKQTSKETPPSLNKHVEKRLKNKYLTPTQNINARALVLIIIPTPIWFKGFSYNFSLTDCSSQSSLHAIAIA